MQLEFNSIFTTTFGAHFNVESTVIDLLKLMVELETDFA